jgi:hypothetical protein
MTRRYSTCTVPVPTFSCLPIPLRKNELETRSGRKHERFRFGRFEPLRYRILRTVQVPRTLPLRLICLCAGERLLGLQIPGPELERGGYHRQRGDHPAPGFYFLD